jgi:3-hydroxyisobutyrate dehydrogenase
MKSIGFIGLGMMGYNMASNIARKLPKSTLFSVSDVDPYTTTYFTSQHQLAKPLTPTCTPSIVITMLPAGKQVRQVYSELFTRKFAPGTLFIDCSTIDPATSKFVASGAADLGHHMIDAPVSGGTPGAEAGTLTFMVGAKEKKEFEVI